jgi:hypothetical protein
VPVSWLLIVSGDGNATDHIPQSILAKRPTDAMRFKHRPQLIIPGFGWKLCGAKAPVKTS